MKQYDKKKDFCIVVACEESQEIASKFYSLGYEVYSVDIQKNSNDKYDQSNEWLYEKTIQESK